MAQVVAPQLCDFLFDSLYIKEYLSGQKTRTLSSGELVIILLPEQSLADKHSMFPLFFLQGPVLGGNDWQKEACLMLQKKMKRQFMVAVPCRWGENGPLEKYHATDSNRSWKSQTEWENEHIILAGLTCGMGCVIAWLPEESKENPRNDRNPYARDSYGEMGYMRGLMTCRNVRFVAGAEDGFPGIKIIKRNYTWTEPQFKFYSSLEETVDAGIDLGVGSMNFS